MKYNSKCKRYYTYIGHVVFNDTMSKFENEDTLKDIGKLKEFKKILRL